MDPEEIKKLEEMLKMAMPSLDKSKIAEAIKNPAVFKEVYLEIMKHGGDAVINHLPFKYRMLFKLLEKTFLKKWFIEIYYFN